MKMNLSQREKRILLITLSFMVVVGGYFGVYENLRKQWKGLNQEIDQLAHQLQSSKVHFQQESVIEDEYDEVVTSLRIEGTRSDKSIKIMQEINALMEEAGVEVGVANPSEVYDEDNFQIFHFSYDDITTNMVQLTRFLELLEQRSKVSEIQS